jgi:hypothetical protein
MEVRSELHAVPNEEDCAVVKVGFSPCKGMEPKNIHSKTQGGANTHTYTHTRAHTHTHTHTHRVCTHGRTRSHTHTDTHTHTHMHMHPHTHIYTHRHTLSHIHTHTHRQTHTRMQIVVLPANTLWRCAGGPVSQLPELAGGKLLHRVEAWLRAERTARRAEEAADPGIKAKRPGAKRAAPEFSSKHMAFFR